MPVAILSFSTRKSFSGPKIITPIIEIERERERDRKKDETGFGCGGVHFPGRPDFVNVA